MGVVGDGGSGGGIGREGVLRSCSVSLGRSEGSGRNSFNGVANELITSLYSAGVSIYSSPCHF